MAYNVSNEYKQVIYSGDSRHKIKILFNNVELQEADRYCERATIKSRIIPNGAKRFSLNNFISKEVEIILHDIDTSIIQDKVSISIGTLVGNAYEYVPIGIFNIQGTPTTDKNKITIKLRDNSVKFDFNYNAKPLIDEKGGSATKLQILQDICSKANVTCNISSFLGSTDSIGIYDNTITARQYIADIAEQAGKIATINRNGELIFVNLNSLTTWNIPLSIVEKYEIGKAYRIGKVVYEDAIRKYETASTNYDTLYLDSSNPYISSQEQVNSILQQVNIFTIDSVKTGIILGNPAIDSYDLIQIHDKSKNLLNKNGTYFSNNSTSEPLNTGVRVKTATAGNYRYVAYEIGKSELLGKTITLHSDIVRSASNLSLVRVWFGSSSIPALSPISNGITSSGSETTTIASSFPSGADRIYVLLYSNTNGTSNVGDCVDYTNLQVEINNYSTDYVPYKDETYTTLATNELVYTGVLTNTFDTQIGEEERKENVSIVGEATFKKWATTNINNINGEIDIQAGKIDNVEKEINPTKDETGTSFYLKDSTDTDLLYFEMEGKTTQETSTQGANLFDENYYKSATYSTNVYKYTETKFKGNRILYAKAQLKSGGSAVSGLYVCISSTPNPNSSGATYSMVISNGTANQNTTSNFTGKNDLYFSFYPASTTLSQIFDNYNIWVSTDNINYEPFIPNMPSPDYPSELVSVGYQNLFDSATFEANLVTGKIRNDSGTVVNDSTSTYSTYMMPVKANKTYTFKGYFQRVYLLNSSGTFVSRVVYNSSNTLPMDTTYTPTIDGYFQFQIRNDIYNSNKGEELVYVGTQVHSYIPYGKYGIEVKTTGKNLFDSEDWYTTLNSINSTNMTKEVVNGIEYYKIRPNGIYNYQYMLGEFKENTQYTISCKARQYEYQARNSTGFVFMYTDGTSSNNYVRQTTTEYDYEVTSLPNKTISYIRLGYAYNDYVLFRDIQMEESIEKSSYEEYKGKTYLYTLNQPLRSIGDTKDLLYIKNGMLYVERKIGSVVLDGSENWQRETSYNAFYIALANCYKSINNNEIITYSDYFKAETANHAVNSNYDYCLGTNTLGYTWFRYNSIATVNDFKSWLSTHNTEVQYILAEPTTEELGQVEVPITYKTITHIDTIDINEPNMNITYVRDTQLTNYVEEHISQIIVNEEGISSRVQTIEDSDYDSRLNAVEQKQTDTDLTIDIISTNIDKTNGEVRSVTTDTGFTFNENGLNIKKSDTDYNTLIDNTGTYYKDGETIISMTNKDGFLAKDFRLQGQHYYSYNATNSSEPLASENYDFVDERIEVDGEYAYATFYNGEV
jgi:hypothetical protein